MVRKFTKAYYFQLHERLDDNTILIKEYQSLKAMSDDINVSYNRVKNLSVGRPVKNMNQYAIRKVYR